MIPGLDVAVCTKGEDRFGGLFIGENDNSVYVGEGEWAVVDTGDFDREVSAGLTKGEAEAELKRQYALQAIQATRALQGYDDEPATQGPQRYSPAPRESLRSPRSEIRRIFLGKRAREADCASN